MARIDTKNGYFDLEVSLLDIPILGKDDTAIQIGCDFTVTFSVNRSDKTGIIQLIHPLTDVGSYAENRTVRGWAVDKHRQGAEAGPELSLQRLVYGDQKKTSSLGSREQAAQMRDTPRELLKPCGGKIGQLTKFANYGASLDRNVIYNEGIIWGYYATEDASGNFVMMTEPPRVVRLEDTDEHLDAIAHFLGSTREIIKAKVKAV